MEGLKLVIAISSYLLLVALVFVISDIAEKYRANHGRKKDE